MNQQMGHQPLLEISNLAKDYRVGHSVFRKGHTVQAVRGVSLSIAAGETLGLVGESGSGKSTVGRLALRLEEATRGSIRFRGEDIANASGPRMRQLRREMQMIFQNPYGALNPRMTVGKFVEEPLLIHGTHPLPRERKAYVEQLFATVGLDPAFASRYPHEFSGGQRQRVVIARALALKPRFIVADEPITALDVSIQAQIINLLQDLQERFGLTYLFVAHDLSMVRYLCSRVAVMYQGKVVEMGKTAEIFDAPAHPYTQSLLSAVPMHDPDEERERRRVHPDRRLIDRSLEGSRKDLSASHWMLQPA